MKTNLIVALTATFAGLATAQQPETGPRWQSWTGCWSVTSASTAWDSSNGPPRTVCVLPASDANVAEVVSVVDGKVVGRDRIDASGQARALNGNGCTGTEQAKFSADGRRVYLKSSVDCGGTRTETSALLAITASGDWVDVRSVSSAGASNVRVARYRDAGIPRDLPSDIASALGNRGLGASWARVAAGAPVATSAVIEATGLVESGVVRAWVMESGLHFPVDAETLVQLADAGVPGSVTDAMIEVNSEGQRVAARDVNHGRYYGPSTRAVGEGWDQDTGERVVVTAYPAYNPYNYYWGFGYPFGFSAYGLPYAVPYGSYASLGYGYGFGYGYYGNSLRGYYPPVIVLHQGQGGGSQGTAVRGRGYTEPRTAAPAGTAATSSGPVASAPSSAPPSAAPASAPSAAPVPPPAASGGRSAKVRP